MKTYRSPDGTTWTVDVESPSHSSALVVFVHPAPTGRYNRYAWVNAKGPQVNDPRARLDPKAVLDGLTDRDLARLFRRSVPVHADRPVYIAS
ncbi:MAG: hypothetical protein ACLGIK_04685 [Gemmatimonadota bacterium]